MDDLYDQQLSTIPVKKNIEKRDHSEFSTATNIDRVLKIASTVLKNSEDVDDFEIKKRAYSNLLKSSISFLMQYRDSLIIDYMKHKVSPMRLPKNIDFSLFIRILPMVHQIVIYNWMGSQKLRPLIVDKMASDKMSLNISEYEKFLSVFMYSDIRGNDYPQRIEEFVKSAKSKYIKDYGYLKTLSYYHLRNNSPELDRFYLKLLSEIKEDLGQVHKTQKSQFIQQIEEAKKNKGN